MSKRWQRPRGSGVTLLKIHAERYLINTINTGIHSLNFSLIYTFQRSAVGRFPLIMCTKDTFCSPKHICDENKMSKCPRSNTDKDETPQVLCEPIYRRCRKDAPCEPLTRTCSQCRPCCNPTKSPNPVPPYGPKCPLNQCGTCVDVERHDIWAKKWCN